jgi:hypothetical protein
LVAFTILGRVVGCPDGHLARQAAELDLALRAETPPMNANDCSLPIRSRPVADVIVVLVG